ncbi:MAG: hypothetical protein J0M04_14040 [Verrucomicrobia bacterium]|nr:hypothetical protein [Verrucomicrobiota bacterium]
MQRIILGDNQFFGINHMSEEKARAQAMRFQEDGSIIRVLRTAYEEGVRAFMCTTHERIGAICDYFRSHADEFPDFEFYPCMPYAHKYVNAITERGAIDAIRGFLPEDGKLGAMLKGGMALVRKDVEGMGRLLVDAEMKMFAGVKTPVIFVQNVITDMLLGLGIKDALKVFADHIREKHHAEPGFITMNLPMLLDALDEVGVDNPIVCSSINKIGFRMCGGLSRYEEAIANRAFRPVAMSIFASGAIPPAEAIQYVCKQPRIESIVFGASSRGNIRESVRLIKSHSV